MSTKALLTLFASGPDRRTEKRNCRKFERQLLDLGIEVNASTAPLRDTLGDAPVQDVGIQAHRLRLERNRQRAAMHPMLFEIHEHQAAWKQLIERRPPALLGRKYLVAVEQHQFVRVGPEQHHRSPSGKAVPMHRSVIRMHLA